MRLLEPEVAEGLQRLWRTRLADNVPMARMCFGAVRLAMLRDPTNGEDPRAQRGMALRPDLPDLYEPLLALLERGGGFPAVDYPASVELDGVQVELGDMRDRLAQAPLFPTHRLGDPVAQQALDCLDAGADGSIRYYVKLSFDDPLLSPFGGMRRRKPPGLTRLEDEAFVVGNRWEPTEFFARYWLGHNDDDYAEIAEIEFANYLLHRITHPEGSTTVWTRSLFEAWGRYDTERRASDMPTREHSAEVREWLVRHGWSSDRDIGGEAADEIITQRIADAARKGIHLEQPPENVRSFLRSYGHLDLTYPNDSDGRLWLDNGFSTGDAERVVALSAALGVPAFPVGYEFRSGDDSMLVLDAHDRMFWAHHSGEYFAGESVDGTFRALAFGGPNREATDFYPSAAEGGADLLTAREHSADEWEWLTQNGWTPDRDIGGEADYLIGERAAHIALRGVRLEPFANARTFLRSYGHLRLPCHGRTLQLALENVYFPDEARQLVALSTGLSARVYPVGYETSGDYLLVIDERDRMFSLQHTGAYALGDSVDEAFQTLLSGTRLRDASDFFADSPTGPLARLEERNQPGQRGDANDAART